MEDPHSALEGSIQSVLSQYKIPLLFGSISLGCIALSLLLIIKSSQEVTPVEFTLGESTVSGSLERRTIKIDIAGGVKNPGVYDLPEESRIEDAITVAGGLSEEVSLLLLEKTVNRAIRISDGAKVYIPVKEDEKTSHNLFSGGEVSTDETSHNSFEPKTGEFSISVNNASQTSLESLPGVGPATARKIISNRPYTSLEELVTRRVVGEKMFEKIASQLSL